MEQGLEKIKQLLASINNLVDDKRNKELKPVEEKK